MDDCKQRELFPEEVSNLNSREIREQTELLKFRKLRADVMLLECKAVGENIALQRRRGLLCYKDAALGEFSSAIRHIHDEIERLPNTLRDKCSLTTEQTDSAFKVIEELLDDLSRVTVTLSSADEMDSMAIGLHRSKREVRAYASNK